VPGDTKNGDAVDSWAIQVIKFIQKKEILGPLTNLWFVLGILGACLIISIIVSASSK
jgi:hypothetical protein